MPAPDPGAWHSLHLHRYAGQDRFLVEHLTPVVAPLRDSGELESFFFLRYWQGGHHIRLRLRPADPDPGRADSLVSDIRDRLAARLAADPADWGDLDPDEFREAQHTMAALEAETTGDLLPPDTVHPARYEPEHGKYGGPAGVAVAERFFARSSAVALDALRAIGERPARRLGTAFTMTLRGLAAAGLTPAAMAAFLAHYCTVWSPYVFDRFLDTWPALLQQRRAPAAAHLAPLLTRGQPPDDPYARAVADAWQALHTDAADILPAITLAGPGASDERRRQVVLLSLLHTHNNRLGLIPEQEAFLGCLGHHVVADCAGLTPDPGLLDRVRDHRRARLAAHLPSGQH
ncbi:thiopeptide-type bacteriocin biosynthesis protein [Streptomyces sp. NPDC057386]|uniref:thiopeptide-type bacteriocin biosynthesis protein n=1 Tax=unclassified Streptomyces TaxID=2593676 RepID=UPI00363AC97F